MVDFPYHQQSQSAQPSFHYRNDPHQQTLYTQVAKATTVLTVGSFLLHLVELMLIGTVISLTVVTPLFVIFSPVLVPVAILVAILRLGFLVSGGFGVMAITMLAWIYGYVTRKHPHGADQLDNARQILLNKA